MKMLWALALVLITIVPAAAQVAPVPPGSPMQVDGQVQWIAGDKMMLIAPNGATVAVDLSQVPLDNYRTLTQRDRVRVFGALSEDNRAIVAQQIERAVEAPGGRPSGVPSRTSP
jgi:hypothetical protein